VELTERIIPARGLTCRGPGGRPAVTYAELAYIAVAQVLLRCDDERHWLWITPAPGRHPMIARPQGPRQGVLDLGGTHSPVSKDHVFEPVGDDLVAVIIEVGMAGGHPPAPELAGDAPSR
jgi:hypothetical protein